MDLARCLIIMAALMLGLGSKGAEAAIITLTHDFAASGFPPGSPVDPVFGAFSVTFDNAIDLTDVTSSVSVTNLNVPVDSEIGFSYFVAGDVLAIGGLQNGAHVVVAGANDFMITLLGASTSDPTVRFAYAVAEFRDLGVLETQSVTFTPPPTPVPEPTALCLLSIGLAGTGARVWRQRKKAGVCTSTMTLASAVGGRMASPTSRSSNFDPADVMLPSWST